MKTAHPPSVASSTGGTSLPGRPGKKEDVFPATKLVATTICHLGVELVEAEWSAIEFTL